MRTCWLLLALLASACSLYSSDPQPDAGELDEPDAAELEADAGVLPDATWPAALQLCAAVCPTQYECTDMMCGCVGPLVPEQRCIGTCEETCGDAGWVTDEAAGVTFCDYPFTPYRCEP